MTLAALLPLLSALLGAAPARAEDVVFRPMPASTLARLASGEHGSRTSEPIVNGTVTNAYPAVGALLLLDDDGYGGVVCSATLVDPGTAVTAAHCVEAVNGKYAAYDAYFAVGSDIYAEDGIVDWAEVLTATQHPDYNATTLINDLGVLDLRGEIHAADPMPVNADTVDSSWVGQELRYVGYGVTTDDGDDGGVRRTADIPISSVDHMFIYAYDATGTFNVCSGDSGGAGLEILGNGVFELTAVNSFVYSPDGDKTPCVGGATGGTRVDRFLDWLDPFADMFDADGNPVGSSTDTGSDGHVGLHRDENGCATVTPSAASPAALLLGLLSLLSRRRGERKPDSRRA
jgi:hypothetical protein